MKILYDCFSCSPYYGSDEGIGWMWPYIMRENHEVWVLVRKDRREGIEKYCQDNNITDMHFIYCDLPDWMNFYYKNLEKKKNGVLDFLFYQYLWQFPAYRAARKAHKEVGFDLVHHASTNDFRLLGRLYRLDIPFVCGPIGGAQVVPKGLRSYVEDHKKSEKLREIINRFFVSLPGYSKALKHADKVYFSNNETYQYLVPKLKDKSKYGLLTEVAIDQTKARMVTLDKEKHHKVRFLWAGRMEYRKGLVLLMDVLEQLPLELEWEVVLCGDGSQREALEKLCSSKAYFERVTFTGKISGDEMNKQYEDADVFVFPSLRETTGTVIVEAMSHGLPVICLNQGGGALVVNDGCGYVITVESKEKCIQAFKNAMIDCIEQPDHIMKMGKAAYERINECYTWQKKCADMEKVYYDIVENAKHISH